MENPPSSSDIPETPYSFDENLLEFIVCPVTKTRLIYDPEHQELISRAAKCAYPIRNGIPVLIPDQARKL